MIELILPPSVRSASRMAASAQDGEAAEARLFPAERAAIARAVPQRRFEFALGRLLAREAWASLGLPLAPLLPGPLREPQWPPGIAGSLTHCPGYVAAAVAPSSTVKAIGIDAEPELPLPADALALILSRRERQLVESLPSETTAWDRIIASAKECVFKAWFPQTGRWLDFHDAEVTLDPRAGSFVADLQTPASALGPAGPLRWSGRYLVRHGLILASVVLPAEAI